MDATLEARRHGLRQLRPDCPLYDAMRGGEARGARHARLLAPHLRTEDVVVELGVGTGLVALGLQQLGYHVIGLDLSPAMLSSAYSRIGGHVLVSDAARLPFRSDAVNQVYCVLLLHLVGDLDAVLREVCRVLPPGGVFAAIPVGRTNKHDDAITEIVDGMSEDLVTAGADRFVEGLDADSVVEHGTSAGLHLFSVGEPVRSTYHQSPADAAAAIERRAFASLLDLDDKTWSEIVQPAIDRLYGLPNPELPIVRRGTAQQCVVLTNP